MRAKRLFSSSKMVEEMRKSIQGRRMIAEIEKNIQNKNIKNFLHSRALSFNKEFRKLQFVRGLLQFARNCEIDIHFAALEEISSIKQTAGEAIDMIDDIYADPDAVQRYSHDSASSAASSSQFSTIKCRTEEVYTFLLRYQQHLMAKYPRISSRCNL
ncbi:hypothetical protein Fsol_00359 [Candidatus Fokinia solitaria]|uniref:Uncharacterized protein n=1 Tax=Candidatus Fokinia solitaria TaxID=1802984 RepID=A0A2U8BS41_9RICK|nr:hypothetical protein [Candidatus Fokinia solitaria]AWD33157.1 hypothetical protein Fsol_00359 [Candidatus Fokinia solitaria]